MLKMKQEGKEKKRGIGKPKPVGLDNKRSAGIGKPEVRIKKKPKIEEKKIVPNKKPSLKMKPIGDDKPTVRRRSDENKSPLRKTDVKEKQIKDVKPSVKPPVVKERIIEQEDLVSTVKSIQAETKGVKPVVPKPTESEPKAEVSRQRPDHFNRRVEPEFIPPTKKSFISRLDIKKDPLRKPKMLTGYPKISELRCKQLTATDIVSENKFAYSENYVNNTQYPVNDDYISLNPTINTGQEVLNIAKIKTPDIVGTVAPIEILPDLDFSLGVEKLDTNLELDIKEEELVLETEELSLEPTELSLEPTELKLEPTELSLEPTELSLEPTELNLEPEDLKIEPDELTLETEEKEEEIILEEELSLEVKEPELEEETELEEEEEVNLEEPTEVEETKEEDSNFLDDIDLDEKEDELDFDISPDALFQPVDTVDVNPLTLDTMENSTLEGEPSSLTGISDVELLEEVPDEDTIEINLNETNVEEDLVDKYNTSSNVEEKEEEEEELEKQTYGKKSNKQEYSSGIDLGVTYDINDLKVEDLSSSISKSFLDDKKEDEISETDISTFLEYGENDALLSKSKSMDEALQYLK